MSKEAMKLALEALKNFEKAGLATLKTIDAITALKQALEQPEPEPVAVVSGYFGGKCVVLPTDHARIFNSGIAFYTHPPKRKPLTDEEIILIVAECASSHQHTDIHFARAIERAHGIKELV